MLPAVSAAADASAPGAFLRQDIGARGAALSGAYGALADDASALYWNPSGLARMAKPEIAASHVILYEDTSLDFGVAGLPSRWGGLALGYLRQSSGGFERRSGPLDSPTGFSITQTAVFAGWGRTFTALPIPVRVGAALKTVRETIDTAGASGWGGDVGLGFEPLRRLQVGVAVQNLLAPRLTFRSTPQTYARVADVSAAYELGDPNRLHGAAALRFVSVGGDAPKPAGGVELRQGKLAALRLGAREDGWATGVGVRLGNLHVDYAAVVRDLGLAHQMTLRLEFGQTREELEDLIKRGIQRFTREEARRLARAYMQEADRFLDEGNYSRAVSDLEAAALWDPDDPDVARKLQVTLAHVEETVRRQILERTTLLAEQQFARGNWIAAQTHWRSVLDLDPDNRAAREALERIDRVLAESARQDAEGRGERQRQESARREALTRVAAGRAALAAGRYRDASSEALAAIKAWPGLPEADALRREAEAQRVRSVGRRIDEGDRLMEAAQYGKALQQYEAGLADDPSSPELRERLARVRASMRAPISEEARKQVEKTYYLAVDAYLKGRYAEAKRQLDEIFKIDPADENARKLKEKVDAAMKLETR